MKFGYLAREKAQKAYIIIVQIHLQETVLSSSSKIITIDIQILTKPSFIITLTDTMNRNLQ